MLISQNIPTAHAGHVPFDASLAGAPVAPAAPAPTNGNAAAANRGEQVALTTRAAERNPYEGVAPGFNTVRVGAWGSGQNDSLVAILNSQGYSSAQVYRRNADGRTLLDEVTRVNNLRNANMIRSGQSLVIPSQTARPSAPAARPAARPAAPAPAARPAAPAPAGGNDAPAVNNVTVDRYNRGPNDTLFNILRNQGFSRTEILNRDANGDSLLNRVARANNLNDPNTITAGSTLRVPNSNEALAQMDIPPMAQRPAARPAAPGPAAPAAERPTAPAPSPVTPPARPAAPTPGPAPAPANGEQPTANMGLLLDGVRDGHFKRDEFQFLNSLSNRYDETRAQFSQGGFSDDELRSLGNFERNYGVQFARLYNRDDVVLRNATTNNNDPRTQVRVGHYNEAGVLWDNLRNGSTNTEAALQIMMRQQAEARRLGGQ